jgi:hypothetical protein
MCPAGLTMCNGWCKDANTDRNHCGTCDKRCNNGFGCINGVCGDEIKCPKGHIKCDHKCVVSGGCMELLGFASWDNVNKVYVGCCV